MQCAGLSKQRPCRLCLDGDLPTCQGRIGEMKPRYDKVKELVKDKLVAEGMTILKEGQIKAGIPHVKALCRVHVFSFRL